MNQQMPEHHSQSVGRAGDEDFVNPPIQMFVQARMENGQLKWDLDSNSSPPPKRKKVILLSDGSGQHRIFFHLQDAGLGLEFDPNNPIYAVDDVPCPPSSDPSLQSGQIQVDKVDPKKLEITDLNSGKARLVRYQLNFVKSDGTQAAPCDPVILNGGGGGEES